ncbi:MAG: hypothetical protein ACR2J8_11295, partial [Thermomicrobiales bacterium]
ATIYVAEQGILARITVVSPAGEPFPAAKKIARSLDKAILASLGPAILATAVPGAVAPTTGTSAGAVPGATGGPTSTGNVAISNPPAAPAAVPRPAQQGMLDTLRDTNFSVKTVGEDICCVSFAEATTLGLAGEVGTLYFRAQASGYVTTIVSNLRYTIFDTPEAAATAWNGWVNDRKDYLAFREIENPATGEPAAVIFTAQPNDDTTTATGFLLVGNVIITASAKTSDWQALLPAIAQRNATNLLLAGYQHLTALFGG